MHESCRCDLFVYSFVKAMKLALAAQYQLYPDDPSGIRPDPPHLCRSGAQYASYEYFDSFDQPLTNPEPFIVPGCQDPVHSSIQPANDDFVLVHDQNPLWRFLDWFGPFCLDHLGSQTRQGLGLCHRSTHPLP